MLSNIFVQFTAIVACLEQISSEFILNFSDGNLAATKIIFKNFPNKRTLATLTDRYRLNK